MVNLCFFYQKKLLSFAVYDYVTFIPDFIDYNNCFLAYGLCYIMAMDYFIDGPPHDQKLIT